MKRNSSKMMKLPLYFVVVLLVVQFRNLDAGVVRTTLGHILNDGYTGEWWTPSQCIACLKAISMEYFNNIQTLVPYCPQEDIYDFQSVESTYYLRNICEYQYRDYFFEKYELLRYNAEFVFGMFKQCLEYGLTYEDREALLDFEEAFEEGRRKCGMENYLEEQIAKFREIYMPPEMPSMQPSPEHDTSLEIQPKPEENVAPGNMEEKSTVISNIIPKVSPHPEEANVTDELIKPEQTYEETGSESDESSKSTQNESKLDILSDTFQERLENSNIIHNDVPKVDVNAATSTTTHEPMLKSRPDDILYHQQEPPALTPNQESQDLPTALPKTEYTDVPDHEKNVKQDQKSDESASLEDASKINTAPFSTMLDGSDLNIQNDIESGLHQNLFENIPELEGEDKPNNATHSLLPNIKIMDEDSKTYESLVDFLLGTLNTSDSIPQENNQLRLNQNDSALNSTLEPNLEDISKYVTNSMQNNTNIIENDTRTKVEDGFKDIINNLPPVDAKTIDVSLNTDEVSKSSSDDSSRLDQNSTTLENNPEEKLEDGSEDSTSSNPNDVKMTDSTITTDDISTKTRLDDSSSRFDQDSSALEKTQEPKFGEGLKDEVNSQLNDSKLNNDDLKTDDSSLNHESPILVSNAPQHIEDLNAQIENQSQLDENSSALGNTYEEEGKEGSKDSSDFISLDKMITPSNIDDTSVKSPIDESSSRLDQKSSASETSSEQTSKDRSTDEINSVPSETKVTDSHLRSDEPSINLEPDVSSSRLDQTSNPLQNIPEPLSDSEVNNDDLKTDDSSLNDISAILPSTASQHIEDLNAQIENQLRLDENSSALRNTSEEEEKEGSKDSFDSISLDKMIHTTSNIDDTSIKSPIDESSSRLDQNSSASKTSSDQKSEDKSTDEINLVPSGTKVTDDHSRSDEPSINLEADVSSTILDKESSLLENTPEQEWEDKSEEVNNIISGDMKKTDTSHDMDDSSIKSPSDDLSSISDQNNSALRNIPEPKVDQINNIRKTDEESKSDDLSIHPKLDTLLSTTIQHIFSVRNDQNNNMITTNQNNSISEYTPEPNINDKLKDAANLLPSNTNKVNTNSKTDESSKYPELGILLSSTIQHNSDSLVPNKNPPTLDHNSILENITESKIKDESKNIINSAPGDINITDKNSITEESSINPKSSTSSTITDYDPNSKTPNKSQSILNQYNVTSGDIPQLNVQTGLEGTTDSMKRNDSIDKSDDLSIISSSDNSSSQAIQHVLDSSKQSNEQLKFGQSVSSSKNIPNSEAKEILKDENNTTTTHEKIIVEESTINNPVTSKHHTESTPELSASPSKNFETPSSLEESPELKKPTDLPSKGESHTQSMNASTDDISEPTEDSTPDNQTITVGNHQLSIDEFKTSELKDPTIVI